MGPRCSSAETRVCHRSYIIAANDMVEEFTKLFLDIARQSIPTKTITVRDYDKPWFNNEIRKEIGLRDRLRKNVFKFGRESDTL